ncbi:MAG: YggT family protein [Thermoleophilia bacterium]|nr:YggT family protein [Thermoleophilia bacterium]
MDAIINFLSIFLQIYVFCVLGWVILSWLPMLSPQLGYNDTVIQIRRFLDSVVLPWVRLFRFIPPMRVGGAMLDLSALVAILVLQIGGQLVLSILASAVG